MSRLACRALWLLLLTRAASADERAPLVELEARRLESDGREVRAEGEVRLRLGACVLRATDLELELDADRLRARHACLEIDGGRTILWADRLELGGGGLHAEWPRIAPCACGRPSEALRGLTLSARRARIARGGRRLHLTWPALRLRGRAVFVVPYVALPLERGVSGLLVPELGYSGRDGLRVEQGGYLASAGRADLLASGGWIQERGAVGRIRGRLWADPALDGELALLGLRDGDRWRGSAVGRIAARGRSWGAVLAPDLVSDPLLPADLDRDADRVFSPYLRSRALAWGTTGPFVVEATGDVIQTLGAPARPVSGLLSVALGVPPVRLLGPLHLEAHVDLGRSLGPSPEIPSVDERATVLGGSLRLGLASGLGPLRLSGYARYGAQATWRPAVDSSSRVDGVQLGEVAAEGSLPLGRAFVLGALRLQHRIEPFLAASWATVDGAPPALADGARLIGGLRVGGGLRTSLLARGAVGPVRRWLRAEARVEVPALRPDDGPLPGATIGGEAELGVRQVSARIAARVGLEDRRSTDLRAHLCGGRAWLRGCAGYTRLRLAWDEELWINVPLGAWTPRGASTVATPLDLDQLDALVELRFSSLGLGARVAVDPAQARLAQGAYWADVALGCGCYRLGVVGASRAGQRWPDVSARLTISAVALSCSR
jgi:hypothetical protein